MAQIQLEWLLAYARELNRLTVCAFYKSRWQVELFFKRINQHMRIKCFFGTWKNAVLCPQPGVRPAAGVQSTREARAHDGRRARVLFGSGAQFEAHEQATQSVGGENGTAGAGLH